MKLWLLRHGQAVMQAGPDAARGLTEHGYTQLMEVAQRLAGVPIAKVYVSPYKRAQQSLDQLRLDSRVEIQTVDWLVPETMPREALRCLPDDLDNVLLVSHQPLLGELAGLLINGDRKSALSVATADLLELEGPLLTGLMALKAHHRALVA